MQTTHNRQAVSSSCSFCCLCLCSYPQLSHSQPPLSPWTKTPLLSTWNHLLPSYCLLLPANRRRILVTISIDWGVVVLPPNRHKIGHFGDVLFRKPIKGTLRQHGALMDIMQTLHDVHDITTESSATTAAGWHQVWIHSEMLLFFNEKSHAEQTITLPIHSVIQVLWHCWSIVGKSIQPVKNWVISWCGYLSGARCRLSWSSWCHCWKTSLCVQMMTN